MKNTLMSSKKEANRMLLHIKAFLNDGEQTLKKLCEKHNELIFDNELSFVVDANNNPISIRISLNDSGDLNIIAQNQDDLRDCWELTPQQMHNNNAALFAHIILSLIDKYEPDLEQGAENEEYVKISFERIISGHIIIPKSEYEKNGFASVVEEHISNGEYVSENEDVQINDEDFNVSPGDVKEYKSIIK